MAAEKLIRSSMIAVLTEARAGNAPLPFIAELLRTIPILITMLTHCRYINVITA